MVRVQNRVSLGLEVLQYFALRQWCFENEKALTLEKALSAEDRNTFYMGSVEYDRDDYLKKAIIGARVYCMKEPLSSVPRWQRILTLLYCLHFASRIGFYILVIWLLFKYLAAARFMLNYSTQVLQHVPVIGGMVPHDLNGVETTGF